MEDKVNRYTQSPKNENIIISDHQKQKEHTLVTLGYEI